MSQLGRFLERCYGIEEAFHSVNGRIRHRKREAPPNASSGRRLVVGRPRISADQVAESLTDLAFWAELPNKVRLESTRLEDGREANELEVVNGDETWNFHTTGVVEYRSKPRPRGNGMECPTEFARHFHRGLLRHCFAALSLEATGVRQVAGRECLVIRAIQLPYERLWPHWLAWEASEFEFAADVERAAQLSIAGVVDGHCVESHEVLEVTYDQLADPALFTYTPSHDELVQPENPICEHLTIEGAAARVPFVVLLLSNAPLSRRSGVEVMYYRARPDMSDEYLTLGYGAGADHTHLWINQRAKPDKRHQESLEWEVIEARGRRFSISDPAPKQGLRVLASEHLATHVEIISDLSINELLELAISMQAVVTT